ncbi:hypothetical protein ABPG72_008867 [Tetrahymena utriculariae]
MVMPSGQQVCSQYEGCTKSNCLGCTKTEQQKYVQISKRDTLQIIQITVYLIEIHEVQDNIDIQIRYANPIQVVAQCSLQVHLPGFPVISGSSCSLSTYPQGYQFNSLTKRCNPQQCKDTQSQKCDQYIYYQYTSTNFYVDGTNPSYCKQCLVNKCQQCNPDGICKICDLGYYLSSGS